MDKRSSKQTGETLTTKIMTVGGEEDGKQKEEQEALDRKIAIATEGFTTNRFCELVLWDRNRLSKENALTICDYIIAMKREINPRINTIRSTIQFLSELSKAAGIEKKFEDTTSALHADKSVERSLANLQYKEQIEKSEYEKTLNNISETSKIIMTYELVTILLIVGAGLAGTSEVTKNKLVGYPGFVIGGTGIIILLLFLFTGTTV